MTSLPLWMRIWNYRGFSVRSHDPERAELVLSNGRELLVVSYLYFNVMQPDMWIRVCYLVDYAIDARFLRDRETKIALEKLRRDLRDGVPFVETPGALQFLAQLRSGVRTPDLI
jgi:hypothetical protein